MTPSMLAPLAMHESTGRPDQPDAAAAAEMEEVRRRMRAYSDHRRTTERRGTAKWLLVLALLHIVLGVWFAPGRSEQAAAALQAVADMPADDLVTLRDGEQVTVGEYRAFVESKVWRPLVVSIGLGVVFAALFFVARKKPVPALLAAIAIYVGVNVVEVMLDPSALSNGIVVKLVCFALLVHAMRSALQQGRDDAASP